MHFRRLLGLVLAFVAAGFLDPALARRTVIDASLVFSLFGYCSPGDAANFGCDSQSLPFALQIDGQTFNSFYINSNGTLSLQSIEPQLAAQNSFTGEFPTSFTPDPLPQRASATIRFRSSAPISSTDPALFSLRKSSLILRNMMGNSSQPFQPQRIVSTSSGSRAIFRPCFAEQRLSMR